MGPEFPGDQAADDAGSLTFTGAPLARPMTITGAPLFELEFSVDRPQAAIAVRLNDVWPDGTVSRITWQLANLCHLDGHETPQKLVPGRRYRIAIRLDDIAITLPAGHALRLSVSTSYWPLMWPSPEPVTLSVHSAGCTLHIPVRRPECETLPAPRFDEPLAAPPLALTEVRASSNTRTVTTDAATGLVSLAIVDDFGKFTNPATGLTTGSTGRETWTIHPADPLSASAATHWTEELEREGWIISTQTWSTMRATGDEFILTARIEAYENGERVFAKDFDEKIPRDHL